MSGPKVTASPFDTECPKCGQRPVTLVTIGDPETAAEATVEKTTVATVTVMETYTFLSCEICKHSWRLPEKGSA
jgi:DNA-directed RNA polymerase subunit M/transcription elongation factor TFIIS